jgi:uridine kinase
LDAAMAKRNFLVDGLSGAGKSSVYEELVRRGVKAISTDRAWAYYGDPATGLPTQRISHDTWIWDHQAAESELRRLDDYCRRSTDLAKDDHRSSRLS